MNTPTHVLVSAAVLAKPGEQHAGRNWAVLIGAIIADLSIFVMYFWTRLLMGQPEDLIWREIYFTPFWQSIGMIANSFPLYASAALLAWWRGLQRSARKTPTPIQTELTANASKHPLAQSLFGELRAT